MVTRNIPFLVTIEDEDRKEAADLIERCRYLPDSEAQKAAVAHAFATARRRDRQRTSGAADCTHPTVKVDEHDRLRWCNGCGALQADGAWMLPDSPRRERSPLPPTLFEAMTAYAQARDTGTSEDVTAAKDLVHAAIDEIVTLRIDAQRRESPTPTATGWAGIAGSNAGEIEILQSALKHIARGVEDPRTYAAHELFESVKRRATDCASDPDDEVHTVTTPKGHVVSQGKCLCIITMGCPTHQTSGQVVPKGPRLDPVPAREPEETGISTTADSSSALPKKSDRVCSTCGKSGHWYSECKIK